MVTDCVKDPRQPRSRGSTAGCVYPAGDDSACEDWESGRVVDSMTGLRSAGIGSEGPEMDVWVWILVVAAVVVVVTASFFLLRRSRRSGSVLAATPDPKDLL